MEIVIYYLSDIHYHNITNRCQNYNLYSHQNGNGVCYDLNRVEYLLFW